MYKLEIIDNQIENYYESNVYVWKRKFFWQKEKWVFVEGHKLGKKYICPEIYHKKITIEDYFKRELYYIKKRYNFNEIHNISINV
jgi:hypothetical protein